VRGESGADSDRVYKWIGASGTAGEVCWGQRDPGCTPVETDRVLVSRVHRGLLDYLLDGCIRLARDGKGGPTSSGGLGMPRIAAVWAATSMDRAQ